MENEKRKAGRPKLYVGVAGDQASSRRQAVNSMYTFEAVHYISVAATEIPESHLLWAPFNETRKAVCKAGILEQLGRMMVQDNCALEDFVYVTNMAIAAIKQGHTTRSVEKAIRAIRLQLKAYRNDPNDTESSLLALTAAQLFAMGGNADEPDAE